MRFSRLVWRKSAFCFATLAPFARAAKNEIMSMDLTSPSFEQGASIPGGYTCEGKDISPPLAWTGIPENVKSFALIVDDPDSPDPAAPKKTWVHWVIYNIPATVTSLPDGTKPLPAGAIEGLNEWGDSGYRGPCPPVGRHRYFFKLYALNAVLAPLQPLSKADLEKAMYGRTLAQATLVGTYEHSKK